MTPDKFFSQAKLAQIFLPNEAQPSLPNEAQPSADQVKQQMAAVMLTSLKPIERFQQAGLLDQSGSAKWGNFPQDSKVFAESFQADVVSHIEKMSPAAATQLKQAVGELESKIRAERAISASNMIAQFAQEEGGDDYVNVSGAAGQLASAVKDAVDAVGKHAGAETKDSSSGRSDGVVEDEGPDYENTRVLGRPH